MSRIAKIVVDLALDREFDYRIPDSLQGDIALGSQVNVPFRSSTTTGFVVGLAEHSERAGLKSVLSLASPVPLITEKTLALAKWISEYYCAPVEHGVRTVLPAAVRRSGACFKKRQFVSLISNSSKIEGLSKKQARVIRLLEESGSMFLSELLRAAEISLSPVKTLAEKGVVEIRSEALHRDPLSKKHVLPTKHLELMEEQKTALGVITASMDAVLDGAGNDAIRPVTLLQGVTGSGKTEVYLQAIDHALDRKKGAIVLVPEISLTPQTVERFMSRFGDRIAVLHSHLSDGERHDEWHRIRKGEASIVIGARSAVFAPVRNLGLIVVDEEHEPSYKQEESPRYHARDVAVVRGRMEPCAVLLGSATPSLESWSNVKRGKYGLALLSKRVDNRRMPIMRVIDMRVETERAGHVSVFSKELLEAMHVRLDRGEQVILFLNRRGYATSLLCPKCGNVAKCRHCSVAYTYHRKSESLRCHICGSATNVPNACPECGDRAFKFAGIGTQRVERIVKKCFPKASVDRLDADITTAKDAYDRVLGDFRAGKTQILIGTQMIAKGLHFPNVTLVGVIYADLSLHIPDFRAGERTFQLLAQVAGRAGRGDVSGEVIVQTYTPFHSAVQAARRLDYDGFCDQEVEFRKELRYPPFSRLTCITIRGRSEEKVAFVAAALSRKLSGRLEGKARVSDGTPAPLAKAKGLYRYQVILRSTSVRSVVSAIREELRNAGGDRGVKVSVDVDAMSLM